MYFGKKIKELREERGMVQRQLAAVIEVDTPMYSKLERGERFAKREHVILLAKELGVDEQELLSLWLADKMLGLADKEDLPLLALQTAINLTKSKYKSDCSDENLLKLSESLRHLRDITICRLYTAIDNYIFQEIDYGVISSFIPQWIADAGINPESSISKESYELFKRKCEHPVFGRIIYYYDIWAKVAAIQDRITSLLYFLDELYAKIPSQNYSENYEYTSGVKISGENETNIHVLINSIFVGTASMFDLISKLAIEQFQYDSYDFSKYKEMKSSGKLFNYSMKGIDNSLKKEGLLFSAPSVIRKICTFRNEYVHNGPWDLRCSVYYTAIDGNPNDVIVYSPDMDQFGNFEKSGSRNKFYSKGCRINVELPTILQETTNIVENTINCIADLYIQKTTKQCNPVLTRDYAYILRKSLNNFEFAVVKKSLAAKSEEQ